PEELSKVAETARHVLIEAIVENDDTLMHQYLEGKEPALGELKAVLRKAVIQCKVIPILCGSALKNKGVQFLLDAIVEYLPSPLDVPDLVASDPKTGAAVSRKASDDEPFTALAFKVAADPYVGKLTFFRVYAGHLTAGSYVLNVSNGERERISRIVRLHANHREDVDEVFAGEIAAAVGLKNTSTGHTLCDPDHPILLESIVFPEPVISVAIEPKTKVDQEKMGIALQRLTEEDPTFRIRTDEETLETIISGMGELHLEIIVERMKREFSVGATVGKPQVAYKETIKEEAEGEGKYIRQTGGRGQYGHCCLRVAPQERGKGYEFIDEIKGAVIPREYIPAIEKGVKEALENGVVAGYPVIDLTVTVYDGSYHEVDSSEAAFKLAGSFAFQEACKRARPILLEPIMKVEVITPEEFLGEVIGDLNAKRGQIKEMRDRSGVKIIDALVPLAEMFGYATTLRSMTQGRASNTMEFSHYEEVPKQIAMAIQETRSGVKRRG
ncbi:translation elongation factor G, partial [Candidatus Uhrbacteria bacterium RIFCSPLOWO2_02_FULL_49_11]